MSLSMDVSGSDELSLDGSESSLLVEAARKNAQQSSSEETSSVSDSVPEETLDPPANVADPLQDMMAEEHQRTVDLELDDSDTEIGIGNRATLQLEPDMNMEAPIASELLEREVGVH